MPASAKTSHIQPIINVQLCVTGQFAPAGSLIFEIYRLAVSGGVNGMLKFLGDDNLTIVAEGTKSRVELFIKQVEELTGSINVQVRKVFSEHIIYYTEFRIIHVNFLHHNP